MSRTRDTMGASHTCPNGYYQKKNKTRNDSDVEGVENREPSSTIGIVN